MAENQNDKFRATEKVGYRQPPISHRFQKGQSGNPKGRPRKAGRSIKSTSVGDVYLDEAQREVRVHDNNETSALPALQIAVRAQAINAVKGNPRAQKDFTEGVRRAEQERSKANERFFEIAIEYKELCEELRDNHKATRMPPPTFDLDPDDLILDLPKQKVEFSLRATHRQKSASSAMSEINMELNDDLSSLQQLSDKDPNNSIIKSDIELLKRLLELTSI